MHRPFYILRIPLFHGLDDEIDIPVQRAESEECIASDHLPIGTVAGTETSKLPMFHEKPDQFLTAQDILLQPEMHFLRQELEKKQEQVKLLQFIFNYLKCKILGIHLQTTKIETCLYFLRFSEHIS